MTSIHGTHLECVHSALPALPESSAGIPISSLVFHSRIHLEENSSSHSHWRKSHSFGRLLNTLGILILIVSQWLPNQLLSVYAQMIEVDKSQGGLPECSDILDLVQTQQETLQKEVRKYCAERGS